MTAVTGAFVAALAMPASSARAAAPNYLENETVRPGTGDITTVFTFAVHYVGKFPPTSVTVLVGSRTIELGLASGTATDGTYVGRSRLPPGTWTTLFTAAATKANSPSTQGASLTVTKSATPTPEPTLSAAPDPARSTAPTLPAQPAPAQPAAGTPASSNVAQAGTGGVVQTATASGSGAAGGPTPGVAIAVPGDAPPRGVKPDARPVSTDPVPPAFWPVMLGGLGVIGLILAVHGALVTRDRRRLSVTAALVTTAPPSSLAQDDAGTTRPRAVWELDAQLEDAPIGTVEYLPLENGAAIGPAPSALLEPRETRRGNQRLARMNHARRGRHVEDRPGLLRRG